MNLLHAQMAFTVPWVACTFHLDFGHNSAFPVMLPGSLTCWLRFALPDFELAPSARWCRHKTFITILRLERKIYSSAKTICRLRKHHHKLRVGCSGDERWNKRLHIHVAENTLKINSWSELLKFSATTAVKKFLKITSSLKWKFNLWEINRNRKIPGINATRVI